MIELETAPEMVTTAAPADCRVHARWSRGRKALAYGVLLALAVLSIWVVDQRVCTLAAEETAREYWIKVGQAASKAWWLAPLLMP